MPDLCVISGTVTDANGAAVVGARLTVKQVVKDGAVISTERREAISIAGGAISFSVHRNSTILVNATIVGLENDTWLTVPNAATATLESLLPAPSPPSTAVSQAALNAALLLKADLASPALTGVPTAPTAAPGTNTTQISTTAFVTAAVAVEAAARAAADAAEVTARDAAIATASTADRARANHAGTQSADTLTDGTTNKAFTATEQTKLAGVATGATANSSDATLLARANHTGTQLAATISDFNAAALAAAPAETAATAGALINGATSKTTPVDADQLGLMDSEASNVLKKFSWANLKARLKDYFDTLYQTALTFTGTGDTVRQSSPTIVTPTIGDFTNATHSHTNGAGGGTLDAAAIASGTLATARGGTGSAFFSIAGPTAQRTYTFPDANATVARTDAAQTFTGNQTISGNVLANTEGTNTIGNSGSNRFIMYPYSLSVGTTSNGAGEARFNSTTNMVRAVSGFLQMGSGVVFGWSSGDPTAAALDVALVRTAANGVGLTNGSTGGGFLELREMTMPSAPSADRARLFCRDNGAGKSQLVVRFPSGAEQVLATEP